VPRAAVTADAVTTVIRFLFGSIVRLDPSLVHAVSPTARPTPFVNAVVALVESMSRMEAQLQFAQLWLTLAVLHLITDEATDTVLPELSQLASNPTLLPDNRYSGQALRFTGLLLHWPHLVQRFVLSGDVLFSRIFHITQHSRWMQEGLPEGKPTGINLARVVRYSLDAADRGLILSRDTLQCRIIPMLQQQDEAARGRSPASPSRALPPLLLTVSPCSLVLLPLSPRSQALLPCH
jgi:hypothetical protein